jgi:hypothetical protein
MFRFIITCASHFMMDKAHGEGIPTIPGWTQGPPSPRPLILRMPPPRGFTIHIEHYHKFSFSLQRCEKVEKGGGRRGL